MGHSEVHDAINLCGPLIIRMRCSNMNANTERACLLHVWDRETEGGRDLAASLIWNYHSDYFRVCLEQQSVDQVAWYITTVYSHFYNGEMNGGESIRAFELMATNWLKVQSSQPPRPCLATHTAMANNATWLQHHGAWQQLAHSHNYFN